VLRKEVSAERATETLNDLLGISLPVNQRKSIKVISNEKPAKGPADYFTGNVTVESRFSSEPPDGYQGGIVNFEAGAYGMAYPSFGTDSNQWMERVWE
jgi:4-carboxymuconolactone decarboxylase